MTQFSVPSLLLINFTLFSVLGKRRRWSRTKVGHLHWTFPYSLVEQELGMWQDEGLEQSFVCGGEGLPGNKSSVAAPRWQGWDISLDFLPSDAELWGGTRGSRIFLWKSYLFLLRSVWKGKLLWKNILLFPSSSVQSWHGALCVLIIGTPVTMWFWLEDVVWLKTTITTENITRAFRLLRLLWICMINLFSCFTKSTKSWKSKSEQSCARDCVCFKRKKSKKNLFIVSTSVGDRLT